ncbi:MAG TPA: YfbM family protein [Steroidobacteraceae bacterium]
MSMIYRIFAISDDVAGQILSRPERIHEFVYSWEKSPHILSLEKSWHGLHFLMTGDAWAGDPPLNCLTVGGEQVGDIDVGYGPARIFRAPSVAAIHEAMENFPDSNVDARLDPKVFDAAQIYPGIWSEPRADLVKEYTEFLQALKAHIKKAADSHQALLMVVQ